jgi:hypothetical protein
MALLTAHQQYYTTTQTNTPVSPCFCHGNVRGGASFQRGGVPEWIDNQAPTDPFTTDFSRFQIPFIGIER